ncbi:MAG: tRNA (guanosine(37)-N1)-methyltransferase TrmD [Gammaproteobacteria bacterium]|nr:tRNA (guanosine(37)-N1)-methyltransferase TrmD [Gammaproteobacteria bacterium]
MKLDIVSLFPEMFEAFRKLGVVGRAIQKQVLCLDLWNPRDFTQDPHRTVDDRPYGGGPGMVMMAEPLAAAIQAARKNNASATVMYLSPQGRKLDHKGVKELARRPGLILVAGRYEGIDERLFGTEIEEEWSIGDYVLSGGELPAMVVVDAVARQLPGVLGDEDSAQQDSFVDGLLDCGHYTRPAVYGGQAVPEVLLSGDHEAIRRWRIQQSLGRTWLRRPDLLAQLALTEEQQQLLERFQQEHESQE